MTCCRSRLAWAESREWIYDKAPHSACACSTLFFLFHSMYSISYILGRVLSGFYSPLATLSGSALGDFQLTPAPAHGVGHGSGIQRPRESSHVVVRYLASCSIRLFRLATSPAPPRARHSVHHASQTAAQARIRCFRL